LPPVVASVLAYLLPPAEYGLAVRVRIRRGPNEVEAQIIAEADGWRVKPNPAAEGSWPDLAMLGAFNSVSDAITALRDGGYAIVVFPTA
jgi:hypothetical protein